ncbi:unnamed protein product [Ectocarpus fasciculatus]
MSTLTDSQRAAVKTGIVHIGIGRFHRAHEALYVHELLLQGELNYGICGVCILPFDEQIYSALKKQDGKYHLIEKGNERETVKSVESIVDLIFGYEDPVAAFEKLAHIDVKIVTFTVTEAGYFYDCATKELNFEHAAVVHDLAHPESPRTLYGYLLRGLALRRECGLPPFTVQSCDNVQGNGDLVKHLLLQFCARADAEMVSWIESNVTFPNSMVDRITPGGSAEELRYVNETLRLADAVPVTCEPYRQWVIEDKYCNGRPDWPAVGVQLTTSVKPYEKIKVRLLNAGHSALGYTGYLLGHSTVDEACNDPLLAKYLKSFFEEVSVTLDPVPGMDIVEYQHTLINRFSNESIKDQIWRICKDGSSKIPGFIMPTVRELISSGQSLQSITFLLASYVHFLQRCLADNLNDVSVAIDDPERNRLAEAVAFAAGDVKKFASKCSFIFAEQELDNGLFMESLQSHFDDISANGVRGVLEKMLA